MFKGGERTMCSGHNGGVGYDWHNHYFDDPAKPGMGVYAFAGEENGERVEHSIYLYKRPGKKTLRARLVKHWGYWTWKERPPLELDIQAKNIAFHPKSANALIETIDRMIAKRKTQMTEQAKTTQVLGSDLKLGDQIIAYSSKAVFDGWSAHNTTKGNPRYEQVVATVVGVDDRRRFVAWNATLPIKAPALERVRDLKEKLPDEEVAKFNSGSYISVNQTVDRLDKPEVVRSDAAETTSLKTVPTKMCDLKVGDKFRINIDPVRGYMSSQPGNPAKRPVAAPATIVEIGKHGIVYAWNEPMESYDPSSYGDCAKGYKHATAAVSGYEGLVEHIVPDLKDQPSKYTDEEIRAVAKALGISNPMDVICENCDHRYGDHYGGYTGPGPGIGSTWECCDYTTKNSYSGGDRAFPHGSKGYLRLPDIKPKMGFINYDQFDIDEVKDALGLEDENDIICDHCHLTFGDHFAQTSCPNALGEPPDQDGEAGYFRLPKIEKLMTAPDTKTIPLSDFKVGEKLFIYENKGATVSFSSRTHPGLKQYTATVLATSDRTCLIGWNSPYAEKHKKAEHYSERFNSAIEWLTIDKVAERVESAKPNEEPTSTAYHIDDKDLHRLNCAECGEVWVSGDKYHHVSECFPCRCGGMRQVECPPGCVGTVKEHTHTFPGGVSIKHKITSSVVSAPITKVKDCPVGSVVEVYLDKHGSLSAKPTDKPFTATILARGAQTTILGSSDEKTRALAAGFYSSMPSIQLDAERVSLDIIKAQKWFLGATKVIGVLAPKSDDYDAACKIISVTPDMPDTRSGDERKLKRDAINEAIARKEAKTKEQKLANSLHALTSLIEGDDDRDCCSADPPIAKEHDDYIAKQEEEKSSIGTAIAMGAGAVLGAFLTSMAEKPMSVRVAEPIDNPLALEAVETPQIEMQAS